MAKETKKKRKSKKRKKPGRKTVMTKKVRAKLKEAFLMDCTDEEACAMAGIGVATLYRYMKLNKKFREARAAWKLNPFLLARKTVVKNLDEPSNARWYLERKKKEEFSPRQELTGKEGESLGTILDKQETDYDKLGRKAGEQVVEAKQPIQNKKQNGGTGAVPSEPNSTAASVSEREPPTEPDS